MIYTDLKHLKRYMGLNKNLDTAITYLGKNGMDSLAPGRNEVDGDNVYINVFRYTTIAPEEAAFEAHQVYADIHLMAEGRELIGVTPVTALEITGTDREADYVECGGPVELLLPMEPGKALVVFPEDAHMVKIQAGEPAQVQKAVVKVRMN